MRTWPQRTALMGVNAAIMLVGLSLPAAAVTPPAMPSSVNPAAIGGLNGLLRFDIPVAWRVTRARFVSNGTSTQTESFSEVWSLEAGLAGGLVLSSPRGRTEVAPLAGAIDKGGLPAAIVITEKNLAKLLGLVRGAWMEEAAENKTHAINLKLISSAGQGQDMVLHLAEDEHFDVHLEVAPGAR